MSHSTDPEDRDPMNHSTDPEGRDPMSHHSYPEDTSTMTDPTMTHPTTAGPTTAGPTTADSVTGPGQPPRHPSPPRGPSWSTVALGLICVVVAGGVLAVELTDTTVDWSSTGPLVLVGTGLLLVLVGLAALFNRSGDDD